MKTIGNVYVEIVLRAWEGFKVKCRGSDGEYEGTLKRVDAMWGIVEDGVLRHRFSAEYIEVVDGDTIVFGVYRERINARIMRVFWAGDWLVDGAGRQIMEIGMARQLGWCESRDLLTMFTGAGGAQVRNIDGFMYSDEHTSTMMTTEWAALCCGYTVMSVRWHGVDVVCDHQATVIEEEDANTVWTDDGFVDVCMDCWGKLPAEFIGEPTHQSDYVFKGTKAQLVELLG